MAKKETKTPDVSAQEAASAAQDWEQFGATGFEQTGAEDLGIPFLTILQSKSPEVDEAHPEHEALTIAGAKAGCIINTLSRELLYSPKTDGCIDFVPCLHQKMYVEWKPRDQGGGFVRMHSNPDILGECRRNDRNQDIHKNGNLIATTSYFFGLYRGAGEWSKAIIAMTSTQLKKSRFWLNLMASIKLDKADGSKFTPPMFSHKYCITTVPESNEKGNWFGWKIENGGMLQARELITQASEWTKMAMSQQSRFMLAAPATDDGDIPV